MHRPVPAVVLVLSCRLIPDAMVCMEYCRLMQYDVKSLIKDDWRAAIEYLYSGQADVLVVADDRTLDPNRAPRVEVVAHQFTKPARPDVPTGRKGRNGRSDARDERSRNERTRAIQRKESAAT